MIFLNFKCTSVKFLISVKSCNKIIMSAVRAGVRSERKPEKKSGGGNKIGECCEGESCGLPAWVDSHTHSVVVAAAILWLCLPYDLCWCGVCYS